MLPLTRLTSMLPLTALLRLTGVLPLTTLLLLTSVLPLTAYALDSSLVKALEIVVTTNEVLAGKRDIFDIEKRRSSWKSTARIGVDYAQKQTLETASGVDAKAGIGVEIPLWDDGGRSRDIAQAQIDALQYQDSLVAAFLARVNDLVVLERDTRVWVDRVQFSRDKLEYYRHAQEKGIVDAVTLWDSVAQVKENEQNLFLSNQKYSTELLLLSREYGGARFLELQGAVDTFVVRESVSQIVRNDSIPQVNIDELSKK